MRKILLLLPILAFIYSDCRIRPTDDLIVTGIEQDWTLPLIDTRLSVKSLINKFDTLAYIQYESDSTIRLHYKGNFISRTSLDIFANFNNAIFPLGDSITALPFSLPNGVHVSDVDVKKGILLWAIRSPDFVSDITLRIPQFTKNGVAFQKTFTASGFPNIDSLDMTGYHLTTPKDSIFITYDARKRPTGERVNLTNDGLFQIKNFEFSYVKGFLGRDTFDVPEDTIKLDFFKNLKRGEFKFLNPKLTVSLDNSFGVPVAAIMKVGDVISSNGEHLALKSPLTNGVNINYPKLNEVNQSKQTVVVFDKSNSNLADIVSFNPVAIDYKIVGLMNPDATTKTVGFITDQSAFKLQVDLDLPIYATAKNFELTDTSKFDVSSQKNITFTQFFVKIDNGMPVDLGLQAYFLSSKGEVIDSLNKFGNVLIKGAPVGSDALPVSSQKTQFTVDIDSTRMNHIRNATQLVTRYKIATTNNGSVPVKVTAQQSIGVHIGARFGVKK